LNEGIAAFVQDKTALERGLFAEELVPEELTQVRMGKIIKDKYLSFRWGTFQTVRRWGVLARPVEPRIPGCGRRWLSLQAEMIQDSNLGSEDVGFLRPLIYRNFPALYVP